MVDYKPLTEKDLNKALFFLKHKTIFKRILFSLAIFIIVLIYFKFFFSFIQYLRSPSYYLLAQEIDYNLDWQVHHEARAPQEPEVAEAQYLAIGNQKYNLVAFLTNPNEDWAV